MGQRPGHSRRGSAREPVLTVLEGSCKENLAHTIEGLRE